MLIVRSPVRISFGGGGTDLPAYYEQFGGAVLSAAINKYFYTVVRHRGDGRIQIISSDLRRTETWDDIKKMSVKGTELEIPLSVLKDFSCDLSVDIFLASEIPPGTGLGSSASVCVNILRALTTYLHIAMSRYELAERAFRIAREVLRSPVGKQDEYAAAFGGLNYISFYANGGTSVQPVELDPAVLRQLERNLLLFFTGSSHCSWTILKDQERITRQSAGVAIDSLHEIKELGLRMRKALMAGELHSFGQMLDEAWQAKKRVSDKISNARIDQLYATSRESGALGGKITGAGGGGFLLLYCEEPHQAAVRQALAREGVREMTFEFDFQGAQVIVNDPFIDGDEKGGTLWRLFDVSFPEARI